eukprot:6562459-Ditylum_brightwellii.AAC.1
MSTGGSNFQGHLFRTHRKWEADLICQHDGLNVGNGIFSRNKKPENICQQVGSKFRKDFFTKLEIVKIRKAVKIG